MLIRASADALPFADRSIDAVVTTWTLCDITDVAHALDEAHRELRPNGRLYFVERGLAPDSMVERWQHTFTPYWQRIASGCHLDRKMDELIRAARFEIEMLNTGYMPGPKSMTYLYQDRARLA